MAGLSADRPSEVVLAARVARQFYLEGVSKIEIADRLGISRFRVARLLDSAREAGMVRIEIGLPGGSLDAGLSASCARPSGLSTPSCSISPTTKAATAAPAGRGRGPGADGPHHARRRPRHVLVAHAQRARGGADPDPALPDRPADRGGAATRRRGPARPGPERGPNRRRPGARLLRSDDPGRCADGRGDAPPGRHRRGVRPGAIGDDSRGRHRRLGARAVDHLRRRDARPSARPWPRSGCAPSWPACSSARTAGRWPRRSTAA